MAVLMCWLNENSGVVTRIARRGVATGSDESRKGHRLDRHRLLKEPVEQRAPVPRRPTIEAEGELGEGVLQMIPRPPALVGAQHPPLQQGGHSVNSGQQRRG